MKNDYSNFIKQMGMLPPENLASFFHEYAAQIDDFIQLYEAYNRQIMQVQSVRIAELKAAICRITSDTDWEDMEGLELTYEQFSPAVTITGSFEAGAGAPLSAFSIRLIMPDIHSWRYYEVGVSREYPAYTAVQKGERVVVTVAGLPGEDTDKILTTLEEVYTYLSGLTVQTFLHSLTSH
ncbi:hypothetical protein [Chitinophaga rhizophila]|uniref:Uncharacterized protein n=1 Tax=Chitinophaga rhizophila TaxID=2866212 RepID=A0ABS7GMJ4_9BACT|nr:hypothetical protein [Chitinophaga rhizophila]MBW8688184.1 hypothetical protein [Chitinophaga rhizophila]